MKMMTFITSLYRKLTSHLKFSSETVVFYSQFTHFVVHNSLDESLDSKLEIAGSKQNVSPYVFMNAGVLLKKCLNSFSVDPALFIASIVDVGDIVLTQEGSEIFRVPDVIALSNSSRL